MTDRLLLTDGTHRNALAVLRTVPGRMEVDVTSWLPTHRSLCGLSKHVSAVLRVAPGEQTERYGQQLLDLLRSRDYRYFLPVGLDSYVASSARKAELSGETHCLLPDWKDMQVAFNKERTMALAESVRVPIPATVELDGIEDVKKIVSFPTVLKSSEPGSVRYCSNPLEAEEQYRLMAASSHTRIMAQEMVTGYGCGFYAVYLDGALMDFFLHRRVREFPVTGGASAVAESYRSRRLFELGKNLGDALNWTGPIMAEFKRDVNSNEYKLIEVNPKLWGSLDLTMAAGVDIPELIFGLADGRITRPIASRYEDAHYKDVRFRWPFPDQFKVFCSRPSQKSLGELLFGDGRTNFCLSDPLPDLFMFGTGLVDGMRIMVDENERYPHGRRPNI